MNNINPCELLVNKIVALIAGKKTLDYSSYITTLLVLLNEFLDSYNSLSAQDKVQANNFFQFHAQGFDNSDLFFITNEIMKREIQNYPLLNKQDKHYFLNNIDLLSPALYRLCVKSLEINNSSKLLSEIQTFKTLLAFVTEESTSYAQGKEGQKTQNKTGIFSIFKNVREKKDKSITKDSPPNKEEVSLAPSVPKTEKKTKSPDTSSSRAWQSKKPQTQNKLSKTISIETQLRNRPEHSISLEWIGHLMAFLGYPIATSRLNPGNKVEGLCYGIGYSDAFSIMDNDISRFEARRRLLILLFYDLSKKSEELIYADFSQERVNLLKDKYQVNSWLAFIECALEDNTFSKAERQTIKAIKRNLSNYFSEKLKNETIFGEKMITYLHSFFDTVMEFHQSFHEANPQSSGAQIAYAHMPSLLPIDFKKKQKAVHFCHPILTVANEAILSKLLFNLAEAMRTEVQAKETIVFAVDSFLHSQENDSLGGHTILIVYNGLDDSYSVHRTIPYELTKVDTLEEAARYILIEFTADGPAGKYNPSEMHGLSLVPLTLNSTLANAINGVLHQSIKENKTWENMLLTKDLLNNSLAKDALKALLLSATPEQIKLQFSLPGYASLVKENFSIASVYTRQISILEYLLAKRLFEIDTKEIIEFFFTINPQVPSDFYISLISNLFLYHHELQNRDLSEQHLNNARVVLTYLASKFNINYQAKSSDIPMLYRFIHQIYIEGTAVRGEIRHYNFYNSLIKLFLEQGANPNLLADSDQRSSGELHFRSLLMELTTQLKKTLANIQSEHLIDASAQRKLDGILSCMKLLISYGAHWQLEELNDTSLFNAVTPLLNSKGIYPHLLTLSNKESEERQRQANPQNFIVNTTKSSNSSVEKSITTKKINQSYFFTETDSNKKKLIEAAEKGDLSLLKNILESKADVNSIYKNYTALLMAAKKGQVSMVSFLLQQGANSNLCNDNNDSPLLLAVKYGHLEVVKLLVANGADLNSINKDDETPFFEALTAGETETAAFLIEKLLEEFKKSLSGNHQVLVAVQDLINVVRKEEGPEVLELENFFKSNEQLYSFYHDVKRLVAKRSATSFDNQ